MPGPGQEIFPLPWLLSSAQYKNIFSSPYTISAHLSKSPSKMGRQAVVQVRSFLVCVSGTNNSKEGDSSLLPYFNEQNGELFVVANLHIYNKSFNVQFPVSLSLRSQLHNRNVLKKIRGESPRIFSNAETDYTKYTVSYILYVPFGMCTNVLTFISAFGESIITSE
jgi:hypothetical protein